MRPANIAVKLRRRSPWEATDLGFAMLRRWWRPVVAVHLPVLAFVTGTALLLGWAFDAVWVAIIAIWWLEPVYDRAVLHVLSRAVFGAAPSPRQALREAREWLGTGLLAALTFERLDLARSFNLPVRQLENQRGREARTRRAVLGRRARGHAVWLTIVWVHFEAVLLWSASVLTQLLLPAQLERARGDEIPLLDGMFDWLSSTSVMDGLVFAATLLILEPFYVAAGFALYLNRRTLLEGWDLEVALRRIAERHAPAAALVAMVLWAFMGVSLPATADAQERNPKTEIAEVLKDREFGYFRDTRVWRERNPSQPHEDRASPFEGIGYALAKAAQVLLWVLLAAAIAYALWWAVRLLPQAAAPPRERYAPPAALFGMELAPEALPPDIAESASQLARAGRLREALSLLYRGSLSELVHKRGVHLLASHTEDEAVRLAGMPYFTALIETWRDCAYANRALSASQVEHLAARYRDAFA